MPKRRANGEGNIRKRKDGRWEGRYTVGHDPETGKAIIKNVLGKTQAEVKEKLKKARDSGLFKVTVPQAVEVIAVFNHSKKVLFVQRRFSAQIVHILRRCSQWKGLLDRSKIAPL